MAHAQVKTGTRWPVPVCFGILKEANRLLRRMEVANTGYGKRLLRKAAETVLYWLIDLYYLLPV